MKENGCDVQNAGRDDGGGIRGLVQQTVDKRLSVWLTQLMDALTGSDQEDRANLKPEFAESLRQSMEQAEPGELISLESLARDTLRPSQ